MFEEVEDIPREETNWPVLDRVAFLIEHACVPGAYPSYCAETAQLLAALEERLRQNPPQENNTTSP
jgi:hypothetical protein